MTSITKAWNDTKKNLWKSANKYFGGESPVLSGGGEKAKTPFGRIYGRTAAGQPEFEHFAAVAGETMKDFKALVNKNGWETAEEVRQNVFAVPLPSGSSRSSTRSSPLSTPRSSPRARSPSPVNYFQSRSPTRSRSPSPKRTGNKPGPQKGVPRYPPEYYTAQAEWLKNPENKKLGKAQFQIDWRKENPSPKKSTRADDADLSPYKQWLDANYGEKGEVYKQTSRSKATGKDLYKEFRARNKFRSTPTAELSPRSKFNMEDARRHQLRIVQDKPRKYNKEDLAARNQRWHASPQGKSAGNAYAQYKAAEKQKGLSADQILVNWNRMNRERKAQK